MDAEPVFPNQVRIIQFNTMIGVDGIQFIQHKLREQQPQIVALQQLNQQQCEEVAFGCGLKLVAFCDQANGGLALFSQFETLPFEIHDLSDDYKALLVPIIVKPGIVYHFIVFDLAVAKGEPKRKAITQLQELQAQHETAISLGTLNCGVKSDIVTLLKLERIQKDGNGHTYNNEEYDYILLNKENFTILRHYVVDDNMWKRDRHRMLLLDCILK